MSVILRRELLSYLPFFNILLGQVLSYDNIKDIIKFCHEEELVLLADEVDVP